MSVIVATAYMEEAAQFDWLAAMYGGKILATGTAEEMMQKTGKDTLERAFIQRCLKNAAKIIMNWSFRH